jgi:hypothetical protein
MEEEKERNRVASTLNNEEDADEKENLIYKDTHRAT